MDREQKIRARARLALRAEQAFGLRAIPRTSIEPTPETIEAESDHAGRCATGSGRIEVGVEELAPATSSDLFGTSVVKQPVQVTLPTLDVFEAPPLSRNEKIKRLNDLDANEVTGCTRCILCERRTNTVFGEGDPDAKIIFIGEGPGENEDLQGRPFVGRAGQLLDTMIAGMGLKREQVFIANIVKCRPPNNREPAPDEVATCTPYLERQIEIIRPKVIVTLGRPAAQHMLQSKISISRIRGQWMSWRGIKLMPTFHPAYILRNYTPETRAAVWDDLKKVLAELGLPVPSRGSAGGGKKS
jgi:uracil-DNA glycosylase family 4